MALTDGACAYLVGVIVADLGLADTFPEVDRDLPPFFGDAPVRSLELPGVAYLPLLERLFDRNCDEDSYFECLAKLHKSRLKYERILAVQPFPSVEQVGHRALLEFGKTKPSTLGAFLFWRKWVFDLDNRAAQETGYLFETIIAKAIGGAPANAGTSPVRRRNQSGKGRQVDCIRENRAYELKLRVSGAASYQGRWSEELAFPGDCRASGFVPVLVVLDSTPNAQLDELCGAFEVEDGESFVGDPAWEHLNEMAGETMAKFLDIYVHAPIQAVVDHSEQPLPPLTLQVEGKEVAVQVGDDWFAIPRDRPGPGDAD